MTVLVPIADLYVQCSLKTRFLTSPVTAMSDCCRASASFAVLVDQGPRGRATMWRCTEHRNVVRIDSRGNKTLGDYVSAIAREKHPAE